MKYAIKKVDRHGKTRWYYHRSGGYWALPCDPETDRSEYDAIANVFALGLTPRRTTTRRDARRPEAAFTREVERAVQRAKVRARMWGRSFDLDIGWVRAEIAKQKCRCALTGIPFSATVAPGRRNPFAPSIDRIDSSSGYTKDNVRIVLLSVNLALADWGEEHFAMMCNACVRRSADSKP
jgi:hypothetical protein